MKISALASLLGVTATTLLPGVSASESESSLRGKAILPGEVNLLELGFQCDNWYPAKCDGKGGNTCYSVTTKCTNICDCLIDTATQTCVEGTCVAYGDPVPSPPSPTPPQRESCRVGANECASNQWCETSLYGQCNGGQGQCSYFLGGACNYDNNPVCGCDGKTYANECQATNAGVNVDYPGSCYNDNSCQVGKNNQCPSGQWCRAFSSNNDQCAGQGTCSYYLGGACPSNYDPVCGCDGNTYANECQATNAGVNVDYQGACSNCQVGQKNACPNGQWCRAFSSNNDQCAGQGSCSYYLGGACPSNYDPVCGCDGVTYANECQATNAGVNVDYTGACSTSDCGISHNGQSDCPNNQWCRALSPGCAVGSPGTCIYFTGRCNMDYNPVCGCDWKDYDNECQAAAAGVNVYKSGTC